MTGDLRERLAEGGGDAARDRRRAALRDRRRTWRRASAAWSGKYAFKYGTLTPIVYVALADSGVELTLRFLSHVRRRRGGVDRVSRRILAAFAEDAELDLAYPTHRVYRLGETASGRTDAHDREAERRLREGGEEGLPPPTSSPTSR